MLASRHKREFFNDYRETMDEITLPQHEALSAQRATDIKQSIADLSAQLPKETTAMSTTVPDVNIFQRDGLGAMMPYVMGNTGATGAGVGAGLGAGVVGGLLAGALTNGGLLGGNRGATDVNINTDNAIAASERLNMARFDAEAQREIQAAVERTAAATQLAGAVQSAALGVEIAKGQGEVNTQIALTSGATQTQAALNAAALGVQVQKTAGDTQTQLATSTAALGVQTEKTAAANALAVAMGLQAAMAANAQHAFNASTQLAAVNYGLATAIKADGDLTRGILIANNDAELNRRLIIAQNEITELRNEGRRDRDGAETRIQISNVNTAVAQQAQGQLQLQQQQQAQAQAVWQGQISNALFGLGQIAQATNQQLIIGNTGAVAAGPQTANPVNVRA